MAYAEVKSDIEVVLLATGHVRSKDVTGSPSGSRTYYEASFHPNPGSSIVQLPDIGDSWSLEVPDLKAVNIDQSYLADRTACGRIWVVTYGTMDVTWGAIPGDNPDPEKVDEREFRTTIELGVELVSFETNANTWKWSHNDVAIEKQDILVPVSISIIKIYRTIYNTQLWAFNALDFECHGKVNGDLFFNIPNCMLLYRGSNLVEKKGDMGQERCWDAELIFEFRSVTGNWTYRTNAAKTGTNEDGAHGGNDGWNWIIREDKDMATGFYGKPYYVASGGLNGYLYKNADVADFKSLLTLGGPATKFPEAW